LTILGSVKYLTGNQIVSVGKHSGANAHGFANRALYRKTPSVNLRRDAFDDNAPSSFGRQLQSCVRSKQIAIQSGTDQM
jgi:hypothetical protein